MTRETEDRNSRDEHEGIVRLPPFRKSSRGKGL